MEYGLRALAGAIAANDDKPPAADASDVHTTHEDDTSDRKLIQLPLCKTPRGLTRVLLLV